MDKSPSEELLLIGLFDGVGGSRRSVELLDLPVAADAFLEIDKEGIRVINAAYPHVIQLGDVHNICETQLWDVWCRKPRLKAVLVVAGFPCQPFSALSRNRKGFEDSRTGLFWELMRVFKLCEKVFSRLRVDLIAGNVASMDTKDLQTVNRLLGMKAHRVCLSDIRHQYRDRFYWCTFD